MRAALKDPSLTLGETGRESNSIVLVQLRCARDMSFFGIVITMNYNDHNPPHFHARYGSSAALFTIDPIAIYSGELPPRAIGLIIEWATQHRQHRAELLDDWKLAREQRPLRRISPLE